MVMSQEFFTNKQKILLYIRKHQDLQNIVSGDIQGFLNIKKSYASTLLTELEDDSMILRRKLGKNKIIFLTKDGIDYTYACLKTILNEIELLSLIKKHN